MNFLDDATDEEENENVNRTILDGNVTNISLIVMEGNYGAVYADDSTCYGYYIIRFSSYPYTLQADMSIDAQGFFLVKWELIFSNQYQFSLLCCFKKTQ